MKRKVDAVNERLVIRLAELMSNYGATVNEIEDTIWHLSNALSLQGHFVLFNRILFTSFGGVIEQKVTLTRFGSTQVNIDRLEKVKKVYKSVSAGSISARHGLSELESITCAKRLYNSFLEIVSWPLISGGFAYIYLGSWKEALCAALISIILMLINRRFPGNEFGTGLRLSIPLSAFVAGICTVAFSQVIHPISITITVISCLMRFMPGFSLTQAMTEIASRRLVSGMAHFCEAIATLMMLATGVFIGITLGSVFMTVSHGYTPFPPAMWQISIAVISVSIGFVICYQILTCHIVAVIVSCILATLLWFYARESYGIVYGTGAAALLGALIANLYARIRQCSDLIIKVPVAIILVPGVYGYRSLLEIMNSQTVSGLGHFLTTFGIAVAIITGYLLIDIIIPVDSHSEDARKEQIPSCTKRNFICRKNFSDSATDRFKPRRFRM